MINFLKNKLLLSFLLLTNVALAEIEQIDITWNAVVCQNPCIALLRQNIGSIKEVQDLEIDGPSGSGKMRWASTGPFSYEPFRYASAAVGIFIDTMRVKVLGTLEGSGPNFTLISKGDGTRFMLLGPIKTEPGRYTPKYNLGSYPLTQAAMDKLHEAQMNGQDVLITGPLLLPSHYPLALITENIKIIENKKNNPNRPL